MTLIGEIYHDGLAVKRDDEEAARWWRLAANLGDPQARLRIRRRAARRAPASPQDQAAADGANSLRRRAQGHVGALYNLGVLAMQGVAGGKPRLRHAPPIISAAAPRRATAMPPIPTACCCARAKACRSTPTAAARLAEARLRRRHRRRPGRIRDHAVQRRRRRPGRGGGGADLSCSPPRAATRSRRTGSPISTRRPRRRQGPCPRGDVARLRQSRRPRRRRPRQGDGELTADQQKQVQALVERQLVF